ncbi:SDR family oxidoreductase [Halostella sp. JP-L12]|uniref:SDR family oxidoreductase n=1 Tax=Halostella TaxID=1843185 RepID=UPI000EF7F94B|nr:MULTISPECIES: SDR family oxidoreductase [Halostella]NHN47245.1 SDR family oxidoreductase [Halostella sp. JP-L12]
MPTVLITGCSSGIGRATARAFDANGWDVYATAPDPANMTELADEGIEIAALDVTDDRSVETAVDDVLEQAGHVDVLVNNAGYGQIGPVEELPTDQLIEQFQVNTFGPHRVTRAVLPSMRERGDGTIINLSSIYGRTTMLGQGAYCGSKFALEALSDTLRGELANTGVDVVLVEPGPVETNFGNVALAQKGELERTGAYEWFYNMYDSRKAIDKMPGYVQPEDVAEVILRAASAAEPDARYLVGPPAKPVPLLKLVPDKLRDRALGFIQRVF